MFCVLGYNALINLICRLCFFNLFPSGNYSGAKEGLARMKYFVNIEEELLQRVGLS